jgi:phage/plasmid-like protein (TIGR03299 family)
MPAYIERFLGNKASNPWWLGMPNVEGLYELTDSDMASQKLRDELFNYTVKKSQAWLYQAKPDGGAWSKIEGQYGLLCSDGVIIPATVGEKYEVFQPQALVDLGDAMAKTGQCRWHTAGILQERKRIWGLAEYGEQFKVGPDEIRRFILFWNAFDGSSRFLAKPVEECVVCSNTADMALREETRPMVAERHTGDAEVKLEAVKELLGIAEERFQESLGFIRQLQDMRYTREQYRTLVCQMLSGKDDEDEAIDVVVKSKGRTATGYDARGGEFLRIYDEGAGAAERGETGWRAAQAVGEYVDWQRGRMSNWKRTASRLSVQGLDSALFGEGAKQKKRAAKLILRKGQ